MPDNLSPEDRHKTMKAVRGKGTGLERKLFAMLAGMGLHGWKRNVSRVLGKPDVVFEEARVVIFAHGCFWHGCSDCRRKLPESNKEYWQRKIFRNIERDEHNKQALADAGWQVVVVWEHDFRPGAARAFIHTAIRNALSEEGKPHER